MPSQLQPGDSLGRYQLLDELGQGGMATVFRAKDPALGREVAVKVMHPHLWKQPEYAARFAREARAVAALRHPHIVEIYDYSEGLAAEGQSFAAPGYIVAELVQGPTLQTFLQLHGPPLPEVGAMIALVLAEALGCAHRRGIIHRDLKPENVMIAEGGRLLLTDFGIARIVEGEAVTQTGALIGSPAYMAPEQAKGAKIDERADLFSLGALLYQLCTGRRPFSAKDPLATVLKVLEGRYEPPLKINPALGTDLDRLIRRLLQVDPEQRYANADEVIAALRELLRARGLTRPEEELPEYFRAPGAYNERLRPRVQTALLAQARQAFALRDVPRTLACCDQLLACEPDHLEARAILKQLTARQHWRRWGLSAAAVVVILGAGGSLVWSTLRPVQAPPVLLAQGSAARDAGLEPAGDAGRRGASAKGGAAGRGDARLDDVSDRSSLASAESSSLIPAGAPDRKAAGAAADRRRPRQAAPRSRDASAPTAQTGAASGRDAGVSPSSKTVDASGRDRPAAAPQPGRLLVAIGPWCEVYIDGKHAGMSPMQQPLLLEPGEHEVVCRQGSSGPRTSQRVKLAAGELHKLGGLVIPEVRVQLRLARGGAVLVDGQRYSEGFAIAPKRYRIDLLRDGQVVTGRWITIPASGCTLVDEPELSCRP